MFLHENNVLINVSQKTLQELSKQLENDEADFRFLNEEGEEVFFEPLP